MGTEIKIPKLAVTMEEGTLVEWLVADGATVAAGDPLYLLETDKTEAAIEASAGGTVRIKGTPGETYKVGAVIGEIE
jgi:pyruvate/2-oxoglutarate dehydrogenase complex dihydrolipoamide acyltransferase (E2) component